MVKNRLRILGKIKMKRLGLTAPLCGLMFGLSVAIIDSQPMKVGPHSEEYEQLLKNEKVQEYRNLRNMRFEDAVNHQPLREKYETLEETEEVSRFNELASKNLRVFKEKFPQKAPYYSIAGAGIAGLFSLGVKRLINRRKPK